MKLLTKFATGWNILILLALFLLANFVVVPAVYPKFQTLDTLSSYTPGQAYQLMTSYGVQGRHFYAIIEVTLDLVYPFLTALMFSLITLAAFQRGFPGHPGWQKLALLPFLVMLSDYLENICVVLLLLSYPAQVNWLAQLSNFFTVSKLILTPLELVFVIGLAAWFVRSIRDKVGSKNHARH